MRRLVLVLPLLLALSLIVPLSRSGPAQAQDDEVQVNITDFAYDPPSLEIEVGTTVTWTNNDSAPHTVTADDGSFSSETLQPGGIFTFTFDEAGTFSYHCEIHPRMTAEVVVAEAEEEEEEATEEPEEATEETEEEDEPAATPAATPESDEAAATPIVEPTGEPTIIGTLGDGSNAIELVGKIDQRGANFTVYGYVTSIAGAEDAALFATDDPANRSESAAFLTFFGSATLTSRAIINDEVFVVIAEGEVSFFSNDQAGASFDVPESFFSGVNVATATVSIRNVITVFDTARGLADGGGELTLTATSPFVLGGETVQIAAVDARQRLSYTGIGELTDPAEPRSSVNMTGYTVDLPAAASGTEGDAESEAESVDLSSGTLTVNLDELNASGVSGTATLTANGDETDVTLALTGATGDHPAHVHAGACDTLDPNPAFPLTTVDANGASVTTIPVSLTDLVADQFAINVHASVENVGLYIACGALPVQ